MAIATPTMEAAATITPRVTFDQQKHSYDGLNFITKPELVQ
jgi:hypothetical protein